MAGHGDSKRITEDQRDDIVDWLREMKGRLEKDAPTKKKLAEEASEALGFPVSDVYMSKAIDRLVARGKLIYSPAMLHPKERRRLMLEEIEMLQADRAAIKDKLKSLEASNDLLVQGLARLEAEKGQGKAENVEVERLKIRVERLNTENAQLRDQGIVVSYLMAHNLWLTNNFRQFAEKYHFILRGEPTRPEQIALLNNDKK
jgi:hypothetical protein